MDGPARKVRKSLVLDTWDKDGFDVQLFQEQLNNAQVGHRGNLSDERTFVIGQGKNLCIDILCFYTKVKVFKICFAWYLRSGAEQSSGTFWMYKQSRLKGIYLYCILKSSAETWEH